MLLVSNALLGLSAVKLASERSALGLIVSFGLLVGVFLCDLSTGHPPSCAPPNVVDDSPIGALSRPSSTWLACVAHYHALVILNLSATLCNCAGELVTHLLWTSDACLLMSILGWVTVGSGACAALYVWYMIFCYWAMLRAKGEDTRRVLRAIAALPCRKYALPPSSATDEEGAEEGGTCAICLGDFEAGEEVRLLPCLHEFCKPCIDVWIERQGLSASCPLCKRMLVPRRAARNEENHGGAPAARATRRRHRVSPTRRVDAMLEPLISNAASAASAAPVDTASDAALDSGSGQSTAEETPGPATQGPDAAACDSTAVCMQCQVSVAVEDSAPSEAQSNSATALQNCAEAPASSGD